VSSDPVARLERRLARERAARLEAEQIAEKGLRDLYLANQNLDHLVTERTLELHSARIELERSAVRRESFLASLSRQVRTPLNGVVGMLDLLEGHISDPQGRSYVFSARASAEDLLKLFSRLILFVDLDDGGRVEPAEVELAGILADITERWSREAMASGQLLFVENRAPSDVVLFTIAEHLELAVGELIDNAISHSGPGSLTLDAELHDHSLVLSLTDPGGGAGDTIANEYDGMGLALAERLAATIGATIEVPDGFDGPTTVTVTVPVKFRAGDLV
jgi:signal transduction histidine kinase